MAENNETVSFTGATERAYCTLGPVPVVNLDSAIFQIENQHWEVRFVAFAGMMTPRIAVPGVPASIPSFVIVAIKMYRKGEKVEPPVVDLRIHDAGGLAGGPGAGGQAAPFQGGKK